MSLTNESQVETAETKQKDVKTPRPTSTQTTPTANEALIYCGPNLPKGLLNRFTIYRGGLPKHLDKVISDCPAISRLFVPVAELQDTLTAINEAGTAQHVWFKQVIQYIQGGAKA